jgi:hypothetical protein
MNYVNSRTCKVVGSGCGVGSYNHCSSDISFEHRLENCADDWDVCCGGSMRLLGQRVTK